MLTNEEFSLFRNIINQESGIQLNESRKDFPEHRLNENRCLLFTDNNFKKGGIK
jgi:hypothetical protein